MPKTPTVAVYLKQLSKPELLQIAKKKKAKIPESWSKSKIVAKKKVTVKKVKKTVIKKARRT